MVNSKNRFDRLFLDFFQEQFSDRSNMEISNFEELTTGWDTEVYSFKISYTENLQRKQANWVLKLFGSMNHLEKARNEFQTMKNLYSLGYPVPRVILLDSGNSSFKTPAIVMEKISGRLFWFDFQKTTGSKKNELITLYCQLLLNVHNLDWKRFATDPELRTHGDSEIWIKLELAAAQKVMDEHLFHDLQPVLDWLNDLKSEIPPVELSLIHGDYHSYNIMLRNSDNKPVVIDWGRSRVGDFRYDLAWTLLVESTYGELEMRQRILDEYQRLDNTGINTIEYFDVLAIFWRLFYIVLTITRGAKTLGYRKGVESYMKQRPYHLRRVYDLLQERTGLELVSVEKLLSFLDN
ncbi:MAG: phosphotransferase family protein [Candidatus Odinarchaeota archaeon]